MSPRIVVLVNGRPRAGKDTVCGFTGEALKALGWRCASVSSVDPVREMLRAMGVPVDLKRPQERALMAEVKSALDRYDWFSTRVCAEKVVEWLNAETDQPSLCFVHIREAKAAEVFVSLLPAAVRSFRLRVVSPREERVDTNVADAGVDEMPYDLLMTNDQTLEKLNVRCQRLASYFTRCNS